MQKDHLVGGDGGGVQGHTPGPREVARYLRDVIGMRCNCDLDNWEPERSTGHSWVCRVHKAAVTADATIKADAQL